MSQRIRIARAIVIVIMACAPCVRAGDIDSRPVDLGVGLGAYFGYFGVNAEYSPIDRLSVSAGVGLRNEIGYDIAIHRYFTSDPHRWSPRVSIGYESATLRATDRSVSGGGVINYGPTFRKRLESATFGVGLRKLWGRDSRFGFAFDLTYVVEDDPSYGHVIPGIGFTYRL